MGGEGGRRKATGSLLAFVYRKRPPLTEFQPDCKRREGCDYQAGGKWEHTVALFGLVGSFW